MASFQRLVLLGAQSKTRGFALCSDLIVRRRPFLHRQISQSTKDSKVKSIEERCEDSMEKLVADVRYQDALFLKRIIEGLQGVTSSIKSLREDVRSFFLMYVVVPMSGASLSFVLPDRFLRLTKTPEIEESGAKTSQKSG